MKSTNKIITLFLIMINVVAISQATKHHISHKPAPKSASSPNYSPIRTHATSLFPDHQNLTPQYIEFLKSCETKINIDCADEIFNDIFHNKTITDNRCCKKLVDMGPDCHTALIERQSALITRDKDRNRVVSRSEDLWRRCERVTPQPKTGHYPKLPPPELLPGYDNLLKDCAAKVTDNCGREVVGVILDKKKDARSVGRDCCIELLKMEHECHVVLVNHLAKNKGHEKKYIKDKGDDVWMHCVISVDG